jgi:hypothetical protein
MSINKSYYVIAGYDLTAAVTDKYKDWKWTDEGEQYLCYQTNGRVQLFDDPMCGGYLYLGHIIASGDEYFFQTQIFNPWHVTYLKNNVDAVVEKLIKCGVIDGSKAKYISFRLMAFEECR